MISSEYRKHTHLARPANGNFCRNEWAILGGTCEAIKQLAGEVISELSTRYKCGYADTSHNDNTHDLPGRLSSGAIVEYMDQVDYAQLSYLSLHNSYQQRAIFSELDLMLVNGNHQQAKAQVVIIDNAKRASLQKRVGQLTNVQLILLEEGSEEPFDFVKEALPGWRQIPIYSLNHHTDSIVAFFKDKIAEAKPKLNGLVLAGGKSMRMGRDKGAIHWHGREQRYYVADLLKHYCGNVFISCRDEAQCGELSPDYLTIKDTFTHLGPFGAILSAFREQPDSAWLVIACDLPLVDDSIVNYLIEHRNPATLATAYQSQDNEYPEPLITIYEAKSYPVMLQFLAQGYSCPRKVLINSDITLLQAQVADALMNVNTPEQMSSAKSLLQANSITDEG